MTKKHINSILCQVRARAKWALPLLLTLSAPTFAESYLLTYGQIQANPSGESTYQLPGSTAQYTRPAKVQVVAPAQDQLTLRQGLDFGIAWAVTGIKEDAVKVEYTVRHPEMLTPEGYLSHGVVNTYVLEVTNGVAIDIAGYGFREEYALIPGDWEVEVRVNGERIAKSFRID